MNVKEEKEFLESKGIDTSIRWNSNEDSLRKKYNELLSNEKLRRLQEIKKFCNQHWYSDVTPCEVIRIISDQTVEIRPMKAIRDESVKLEWEAGGFAGHCSNQRDQKWFYESDETREIIRVRFSKANRQWQKGKYQRYVMSEVPINFHDYNF